MTLAAVVSAAAQQPTGARNMGQGGMMQNCPMNLSGVEVAVADTSNGISVTFTAKPADVKELQRRAERMADMHSMAGTGTMPHTQGPGMLAGDVKYEARPDGARLILTPKDPSKLAEFRAQVRAHVEQMKKGNCAMMEEMMRGMHGNAPPPTAK
jgi:hypothetical protein